MDPSRWNAGITHRGASVGRARQVDIRHRAASTPTLRRVFINRAFRDYFSLPDDKGDSKPHSSR